MRELNPLLSTARHNCPGGTPPIYFGGRERCFTPLPGGFSGIGGPGSFDSTGPATLSIFDDPSNKATILLGGPSIGTAAMATAANIAAGAALVYHGYKRNHSVIWAILWGFTGLVWPLPIAAISLPIALAQGFAKPKRAKPLSGLRRFRRVKRKSSR